MKNPVVLPEEITKKYIILDILATDESGRSCEIEMQVRRTDSYPKRALYYLSRIYAGQLESGEDYGKLKPVIGIHFLDYEMFPDNSDFHFRFEMRDIRHLARVREDALRNERSELFYAEKRGLFSSKPRAAPEIRKIRESSFIVIIRRSFSAA